jgi:hypothetical protein
MSETQKIPWKRIAVEATAIVASILLAFAIDAGWQEYIEDQREREVLNALLDDFETTKANIKDWRNFHLAVQQSNTKLLKAVTSSEITLTNDQIGRLLSALSWWDSESHFSTGALNSLVYGGELSLIEDDALRQLLADWPSRIQNFESQQQQDYDFFLNVWTPFLRANSYLPLQSTTDTPVPGRPEEPTLLIDLQLEGTWSYAEMVASKEFHNILAQKLWIQFDILVAFAKANVLIDQTIQRIESSL